MAWLEEGGWAARRGESGGAASSSTSSGGRVARGFGLVALATTDGVAQKVLTLVDTATLGALTSACRALSEQALRRRAWAGHKRREGVVGKRLFECYAEDACAFAVLPRSLIAMGTSCGPVELWSWEHTATEAQQPLWGHGKLAIAAELWAHDGAVDGLALVLPHAASPPPACCLLASSSSTEGLVIVWSLTESGGAGSGRSARNVQGQRLAEIRRAASCIDALPSGGLALCVGDGSIELWYAGGATGDAARRWHCARILPAQPRDPQYAQNATELFTQTPVTCIHTIECADAPAMLVSCSAGAERDAYVWSVGSRAEGGEGEGQGCALAAAASLATPLLRLSGHRGRILCLVVLYTAKSRVDATRVATGAVDGAVRLWSVGYGCDRDCDFAAPPLAAPARPVTEGRCVALLDGG